MKNNVALYIGADPFTFNDLDLVQKSIKTFGFVNIFLDRKNRDAEYREYFLNYTDRFDIISHDLNEKKITNFRIIPVDETVEKALSENNIDSLILNFDYQQNIDFRMMKVLQYVNPNLPILLMRGDGYIEKKFIKTLMDSDSSMQIYKKFCSDYAFTKLKIKTMFKVGLTGMIGAKTDMLVDLFKEKGYMILDLDEFVRGMYDDSESCMEIGNLLRIRGAITPGGEYKQKVTNLCARDQKMNDAFQRYLYKKISLKMGNDMSRKFEDKILVKFYMLCEFGMEQMMDRTFFVEDGVDPLMNFGVDIGYVENLRKVQMKMDEKKELCDYILGGDCLVSDCLRVINSRSF